VLVYFHSSSYPPPPPHEFLICNVGVEQFSWSWSSRFLFLVDRKRGKCNPQE